MEREKNDGTRGRTYDVLSAADDDILDCSRRSTTALDRLRQQSRGDVPRPLRYKKPSLSTYPRSSELNHPSFVNTLFVAATNDLNVNKDPPQFGE